MSVDRGDHSAREQDRGPRARVVVVDPSAERREQVAQSARAGGATVVPVGTPEEALPLVAAPGVDCVAVAAEPDLIDGDGVEELFKILRRREIPALCYARDAEHWPMSLRCRLLLRGTNLLFDSASATFVSELGRELQVRLHLRHAHQEGQRALLETMAALGIYGSSSPMVRLLRAVMRLAPLSDLPVLLTGETGTGKELVARALHRLDDRRRSGPMIAVNCAALPPALAEAELFGHRRGAFSGADRARAGLFRAANGGVLFLDEVGELSLELQSKLLRALQEGRVLALGDDEETAVDVRVIAATHRDLGDLVCAHRFREDLFQRLSVVPLHVPPLRERRGDIAALVQRFLVRHGALRPHGPLEATPEFVEALSSIRLPGNVRQLENIVRRALAEADHARPLGLGDLPAELWQELADEHHAVTASSRDLNLARSLDACERATVVAALARAEGSQTRAARLLGITGRSVYNKIRKHGLDRR